MDTFYKLERLGSGGTPTDKLVNNNEIINLQFNGSLLIQAGSADIEVRFAFPGADTAISGNFGLMDTIPANTIKDTGEILPLKSGKLKIIGGTARVIHFRR